MPYSGVSDKNLPDNVKKMSSKMKKIWVSSFNSAFDSATEKGEKDPEAYAFKVANSAVKKASNKKKEAIEFPEGTEFVSDDELLEFEKIDITSHTKVDHFVVSLKEAQIDEEKHTADIVAIRSGWSYNGNYYSKEVAESLVPLLLQRKKIFCNHTDEKKFGRKIQDLAAIIQESNAKDGSTLAKIWFNSNPATGAWLFEMAQKHPEEVQFSIDAMARVHEGEMEGRKGCIVDKFVGLNSLDIVDYASAGGIVLRTESREEKELSILEEAASTLKDRVEKHVNRNKLEILMNMFVNMLYELSWAYEVDGETSKKEKIQELVDSFLEEFDDIDIVKAFEAKQEKEGVPMTLDEVKKDATLLASIKKEMVEPEVNSVKESLISEKAAVEAKLLAKETELQGAQSELVTVKNELNGYKLKEELLARETNVRKIVSESELKDFDKLPEYIKKDLLNKEKEEDVKEAIKAIESVIKNGVSGKIEGVGVGSPAKPDEKKDTTLATDNEKAASVWQ